LTAAPARGESRRTYDYVIVGAGPAGCVLAARLTEDPDVNALPRTTSAARTSGTAPAARCRSRTGAPARLRAPTSSRPPTRSASRPTRTSTRPEQDGVGWYQVTQRDGKRASAAVAYLHPAMSRPNLEVRTGCHVLRVLFDGTRAVGIQAAAGERVELRAERELVVSGGAYNSPQILMLWGLGRPEELGALQIPVVAEAPAVGLNLSDHPTAGVVYASEEDCSLKGAL
jgi:choline dehydrogenase-like flavoprotein